MNYEERRKWLREHYPPEFNKMNTIIISELFVFGLAIMYFSFALNFKESYMEGLISLIGLLYIIGGFLIVRYILRNRKR